MSKNQDDMSKSDPTRASVTDDLRWGMVSGRQSEITSHTQDLVPNLPDSMAPEVRSMIQRCYDPHPAVRLGSIVSLTVMALKESRSHFEGKTQVLGHMLQAMSWRESDCG